MEIIELNYRSPIKTFKKGDLVRTRNSGWPGTILWTEQGCSVVQFDGYRFTCDNRNLMKLERLDETIP